MMTYLYSISTLALSTVSDYQPCPVKRVLTFYILLFIIKEHHKPFYNSIAGTWSALTRNGQNRETCHKLYFPSTQICLQK